MAEHAVTSLISNLGSLLLQEANFIRGVKTQIEFLHEELEWINSFLRDADEKRKRNRRANLWVRQIRDLAFDAEDIIDLYRLQIMQRRQIRKMVLKFVGYPKHFCTIHKLGNEMKDINRRIVKISNNKSKYGIEAFETGETSAPLDDGIARTARIASMEEEVNVVGFEEQIKELTSTLLKQEESQRLVVSIVGMGGSGKTTLARTVYNSKEVKETFDSRAWVYVSQNYKVKDLLSRAIAQLMKLTDENKEGFERKDELELKKILSDHLEKERCLLAFDDVWKIEDWDKLKEAFLADRDEEKQQRVLLTSRNVKVAERAGKSTDRIQLRPLDDRKSFELFSLKILSSQRGNEERSDPKDLGDLEDLGKKFVAKCDGLPLAIVVLVGLLSTKEKTPVVWDKLLKSVSWQLNQGPQHCMDILALSYTNLPYYLQSCFLYFGFFPKSHEIRSRKLIRLWIAEGFIQERGDQTIEDVAEEYLKELIERNMIQATRKRSDEVVDKCRIHDLLWEFAASEAKKDKLFEFYGSNCSNSLNRFRRLVIHPNNGMFHSISSSTVKHLHSLLCFGDGLQQELWKVLGVGFHLLKVLDLEDAEKVDSLPEEIGRLFFLKYLNIYGTKVCRIPQSIGNLSNMQTLDLSSTKIRGLPEEIWRMEQLRHLFCFNFRSPLSFSHSPRIDNLGDLQTLWLDAGSWIEGGLDKLTNLRELRIRGDWTSHTKALTDALVKLKKLEVLCFWENRNENAPPLPLVSFSRHLNLSKMDLMDGRLEKLPPLDDFPPYLRELLMSFSHLKQEDRPMATLEKLPKLKILKLGKESFEGKEMICSAEGFSELQTLELQGLRNLKYLKVDKGAFRCLKVLTIGGCNKLKMLPDGLRHVTELQELNIRDMPEEFKARAQKETGDDWKKIKHIERTLTFKEAHKKQSSEEYNKSVTEER